MAVVGPERSVSPGPAPDTLLSMQMAKRQIVDLFVVRGDLERAELADASLPDLVDLREHADAVRALGIDPALLATQIDNLEG